MWKRIIIAVVLLLVGTFIGLLLAGLLPGLSTRLADGFASVENRPAYTAHSLVYVSMRELGRAPFPLETRTQIELVRNRLVYEAALRYPEVTQLEMIKSQSDPVEWLESQIMVESPAPDILRISANGDNADELAVLVKAVAKAFIQEVVDRDRKLAYEQMKSLKALVQQHTESNRQKEAVIRKQAERVWLGIDPAMQQKRQEFTQKHLELADKELFQFQSEIRKLKLERDALEGRLRGAHDMVISDKGIEEAISKDPKVALLNEQMAEKKKQLDYYKDQLTGAAGEARLKRDQAEIEALQKELDQRKQDLRPVAIRDIRASVNAVNSSTAAQIQERLQTLDKLEKLMSLEVRRLLDEAKEHAVAGLDVSGLQADIEMARQLIGSAVSQMERLKLDMMAAPRFAVLEDGVVKPYGKSRKRK